MTEATESVESIILSLGIEGTSQIKASGEVLGKFVDNLGYGGARGVVFLVNSLIIAPVLMHRLGPQVFALFALATPFLRYGFSGVFDLGLATALMRFVSREAAASNGEEVNRYLSSVFSSTSFSAACHCPFSCIVAAIVRFLLSSNPDL